MRKTSFNLSAGTMLALIAMPALAAPERVETAVPLPPAISATAVAPPVAKPRDSDSDVSLKGAVEPAAIGDAQIADRLRAIVMDKQLDVRIDRAPERQAVEAFYAARNYAPLWSSEGRPNARANSVIAQLKNAAADGLDPADYPVPDFAAAADAERLADADIRLTNVVLAYARHLASGRVAPTRVLAEVDYGNHTPDPADILRKITQASDAGAALESYNPPHEGFRALRAKLAELKPGQERDRVLANMERWRWLPRDLGKTYVMVNIPDFSLRVMHDHQEQWRTKIIAGKPQTPTPLLSAAMDNVLVNPSWHVPQSIIQNELLPRYGSDPNIFSRMGLEVKRRPDGSLSVTQPPGAANALGRIKFNFPNKFQVYLHDTPDKRLFANDKRAFSHGCMRVQDPTKFGEIMLHLAMNGPTPNSQQISALFGHAERTFKLTDRPMVHLTYQTAFVDGGRLVLRDDIYGFDARISAILRSAERRIADVTPPPDPKRDLATAKASQDILRRVERGEADNALKLLDQVSHEPARTAHADPKRPAAKPRAVAAAAPGFHQPTPTSPLALPFLAIFGR